MTRYRFLDPMGDVVAEEEFPDREAAMAAAAGFEDADVFRVEYLDPADQPAGRPRNLDSDWRWAGALET